MRHYYQLMTKLLPRARGSSQIIGKGPSFDPGRLKSSAFKVSINEAWTRCDGHWFDMCVFHDWGVAKNFKNNQRVDYFVTSTKKLGAGIDYLDAIKNARFFSDKLYFFDSEIKRNRHRVFLDTKPIRLTRSTTEAAVYILAEFGFKDIEFIGIDGSIDYHHRFKQPMRQRPFDAQFINIAKIGKEYGINFHGLPKFALQF